MITAFHGLPAHGLPLLTMEHPSFGEYVADVSGRGFAHPPEIIPANTAVLVNETGRSVLALVILWTFDGGNTRRHTCAVNFGSSGLLYALLGHRADSSQFIAPGSKRLITPDGFYGDNSDVLSAPARPSGMGFAGGGSRGGSADMAECRLDFVLLGDGRCAGPDESGTLESLRSELEEIRTLTVRLEQAIQQRSSPGALFEILRPVLRRQRMQRGSNMLMVFGRMALDQLIEAENETLREWLKPYTTSKPLELRRAELSS